MQTRGEAARQRKLRERRVRSRIFLESEATRRPDITSTNGARASVSSASNPLARFARRPYVRPEDISKHFNKSSGQPLLKLSGPAFIIGSDPDLRLTKDDHARYVTDECKDGWEDRESRLKKIVDAALGGPDRPFQYRSGFGAQDSRARTGFSFAGRRRPQY